MNIFVKLLLIPVIVICLALPVFADTANPSTASPGYMIMTYPITTVSTSVVNIRWFKTPWPAKVMNVMSMAKNGSTCTYTIDVKAAGTSVLTTSLSASYYTYLDANSSSSTATIHATNGTIADEAAVTLDIGTRGCVWYDGVVEMILKRL